MGDRPMMEPGARPKPGLRPFLPADVTVLAEILRASIEELTSDDYSEAQQQAWASVADDEAEFGRRLARAMTLLAILDGAPVGFASVERAEHLDMLYVHPAAAGRGVGSMLVDAVVKLAAARGISKLTADVSDSALGFFRRLGFVPQQRKSILLGDEWLASTTMHKELVAKEQAQ